MTGQPREVGAWGRWQSELKAIREENRRLKTLVADLSLDKTILQEALRKKW